MQDILFTEERTCFQNIVLKQSTRLNLGNMCVSTKYASNKMAPIHDAFNLGL